MSRTVGDALGVVGEQVWAKRLRAVHAVFGVGADAASGLRQRGAGAYAALYVVEPASGRAVVENLVGG